MFVQLLKIVENKTKKKTCDENKFASVRHTSSILQKEKTKKRWLREKMKNDKK